MKENKTTEEELELVIVDIFEILASTYYDDWQAKALRELLIESSKNGLFEKVRREICQGN